MAIKLTTTMQIPHYVNVLCYGDAGAGKTFMCQTAPSPLIISTEGGLLSLADHDLPVFEVVNRVQLNEVHAWLESSKEAKQYKTICLDSISEIAEVILAEELANTKDGRAAYGEMASLMTTTIRGFRDLDFHTYFTAKVKKVVDETSSAITYMPSVPGQLLLNNLPYLFDEVVRIEIGKTPDKQTYRYLQTTGDRRYVAKDRSGKLADKEKPDLKYIFDKILVSGEPMTAAKTEVKSTPKMRT